MVEIKTNLANKQNYGAKRKESDICYIVVHYSANDGDKDENNGIYFHNNVTKTSAHYFVDSDSITQSVPDNYVAYAVGGDHRSARGGASFYKICNNGNSISIELCDDNKNGVIYPSDKTIDNALDLVRSLMKKYNIPKERVIRHFDVNGKICPAYWVDDKKWKDEFWNKIDECPVEVNKTYTLQVASFLRTSATVNGDKNKVKYDSLSDKNKEKCTNVDGYAKAKVGTKWTVKKIINSGGNIWIKNGSGYYHPAVYNDKIRLK